MPCPARSQSLGPPGPVPRQHVSPLHTVRELDQGPQAPDQVSDRAAQSQVLSGVRPCSPLPARHPLRGPSSLNLASYPSQGISPDPMQTSPQPSAITAPSPPGRAPWSALRVRRDEVAAASGRLSLAGAGSGGGAGGWAPARGCQGSRHACLRAGGMAPSRLSLGAPAPQSPVQTGKQAQNGWWHP